MILLFLPLFLSLRLNSKKHCSKILSLTSIISTISIVLAVSVLIIGVSAMNGFEYELNNRVLSVIPHFEIENNHKFIKNWNKIIKFVEKLPDVVKAVPYIKFSGLLEKNSKLKLVQVKGIDYKNEQKFSNLINFISKYKNWKDFKSGENNVIIGSGIAKILNIKIGDWVEILISNFNLNKNIQKLFQPITIRLHVTGIIKLNSLIDYNLVLLPLEDAQKFLNIGNKVTGIGFKIKKPFKAKKFIKNNKFYPNYNIYSWTNKYGYIYQDIKMIRTVVYLAMILVIVVAFFNIISTLIFSVKNKNIDIVILRTLGATNKLIYQTFILYGLLNCILGSIIGLFLGIFISLNLTKISKFIEHLINHSFLFDDIYFINFIPSKLDSLDIILTLFIIFIISLFACWYPARYANNINNIYLLNKK